MGWTWFRPVAVAAALVTLASAGVLTQPVVAEARADVEVTASSSLRGTSAARLTYSSNSRRAVWVSRQMGAGAEITTRFTQAVSVRGAVLRGVPGHRIEIAQLQFSDGSTIRFKTDARGDRRLAFSPRAVRWVRLVVVSLKRSQRAVALAGWRLSTSPVATPRRMSSGVVFASRVSTSSGLATGTAWTAADAGGGQWVRVALKTAMSVSAVRISGGAASTATTAIAGYLKFSDGSRVLVGALEPAGGTPTTIAFTPRTTSWVKYVITAVRGSARAATRSVEVYPVGSIPSLAAGTSGAKQGPVSSARSCAGVAAVSASASLVLLCPTNGDQVNGAQRLVVRGPASAQYSVTAWLPSGASGTVEQVATGRADASGTMSVRVPLVRLARGPIAVRLSASGVRTPLTVQLVNVGGVLQSLPASSPAAGMDLKLDESFSSDLSTSRTGAGALYASGKPNSYGVDDFGEAIFAQPDGSADTMATIPGGFLRIRARALSAGEKDPAPYGRTSKSGLMSSGHIGASGFSAQYGYFEARMLAPAVAGTWPAFWTLSTGSLTTGGSTGEIDVAELYGEDPISVYQTSHSWANHRDLLGRSTYSRIAGGGDTTMSWHTYGAKVNPSGVSYYVDGRLVGSTPATVTQSEPFFFLADLALKKGWQTGLASVRGKADLYIDYIRVWV